MPTAVRNTPLPRRRSARRRTVTVVIAALMLPACTTFTDNDAAARVGDTVLNHTEFDVLAAAATGQPDEERVDVPINVAHGVLNTWIVNQIVSADLRAAGVTPDAADEAPTSIDALFAEQEALFAQWDQLPPPSDDVLRAEYDRGPRVSGVACTAHILTETEDEALAALAQLDAGATFADVAAERSTDTVSAVDGGALGCTGLAEFTQMFIPEYVEAALDARIGVPTDPVESIFGFHVVLVRPFDEIADDPDARAASNQLMARFRRAALAADVHVDPRLGAFDIDRGVQPLGPPPSPAF